MCGEVGGSDYTFPKSFQDINEYFKEQSPTEINLSQKFNSPMAISDPLYFKWKNIRPGLQWNLCIRHSLSSKENCGEVKLLTSLKGWTKHVLQLFCLLSPGSKPQISIHCFSISIKPQVCYSEFHQW